MILSAVAVFGVKLEKRQFQFPSNVNIPIPNIPIPPIPDVPVIPNIPSNIPVPTIPANIVDQIQSQLPALPTLPAAPTIPGLPFGIDEQLSKVNYTGLIQSIDINDYQNQAKDQIPNIPQVPAIPNGGVPTVPSQQDLQKFLDQAKAVAATYLPTTASGATKRSPSSGQTLISEFSNANSNSPFFITSTVGLLWLML